MAFAVASKSSSSLPAIALTLVWRGTQRSWSIRRASGLMIAGALSFVAIWYLGATAYLVFHDQLVASLISHQADVQYSYEDRIAVLQTELDRQTSRALLDQQVLATTIKNLASKSEQLETHAVTLDALMRSLGVNPSSPRVDNASPAHDDHAEAAPLQRSAQLAAALDKVEARQSAGIALLRGPLMHKIERLQTALMEAGMPRSRWKQLPDGDVGGPFVPLPDGVRAETFEQNLSLLRSAIAEHARLTSLADVVPLRRPIGGPLEVTSPFGARVDPFLGQAAMHTGMDLMGTEGAPVRATANGTVTVAGSEGGYGNMVEVDHGDGLVTRYAHLSAIDVVPHQKVSNGTIVGRVGSTGRATGPHLHYETRINGVPVDPARFLKAGAELFPAETGRHS